MKPYQLIQVSVDLDDRRFYILPPSMVGNPYKMLIVHDWVLYPDMWEKSRASIPNLVPDGRALLERNYRANRTLGFKHDWRELWGREEGKTCLLMGCGPSLSDSIEEIRNLRGKPGYFTMAINRAIRTTSCDYYFVLDRRAASDGSGISDWIVEDPRNTRLIASTSVCSDIAPKFKNRFWGEHHVTAQDSGKTSLGVNLLITLCDAMHAAYKLGAKEILLYGCDFSMSGRAVDTPRGKRWQMENYYSDMTVDQGFAIRIEPLREGMPVIGIDGTVVFVNWELVCNAAYATCMAMMLAAGGVRVRNRSPRGILWETWHEHDVSLALPVCAEAVPQSV